MHSPKIIAICGLDGSGKSMQVSLLTEYLRERGYRAQSSKVTPLIGTDILLKLSEVLYGDPHDYYPGMPPEILNTVLVCDFARHYLDILNKSKELDILVCDRYKLCYEVYAQAYGSDMKWIRHILSLVPDPTITFYLETPVEVSTDRLMNRTSEPIRKDENPDILAAAKEVYRRKIIAEPSIVTIDGCKSPDEILYQIVDTLANRGIL
jgi:dTMP kinase